MVEKIMLSKEQLLTIRVMDVMDEIASEFGSRQDCGSREFAVAIQKVNAIKPFLEISEEGLRNLIDLAFNISLKKEESRYPRFQIYVPSTGFFPARNGTGPEWMVRFEPLIVLDISTLHRISSGIPSRPYALCIWESEETIEAYGIIRIEDLSSQSVNTSKSINVSCYPGLILSIEEPGILNASLCNTRRTIIGHLTLRYGRIEQIHNSYVNLIVQSIYDDIYTDIKKNMRASGEGELSPNILGYIGNIWSYILSLAVDFKDGGQFIILPSGPSLDTLPSDLLGQDKYLRVADTKVLKVKHTTIAPDLGAQIIALDQAPDLVQRKPRFRGSNGEEIPEDSAVKKGFDQSKRLSMSIDSKYQTLFDSARAVAKLSTVDGCLVFDRGLRLLGFKGEVLVKEDPECVELNLDVGLKDQDPNPKDFDINQYGTRHRSAARFCGKVPGAVVFVVSQDGDIRLFLNLDNGKVGVGGPFRPLPGLSPSIVHS
jgi:hypothetical protein